MQIERSSGNVFVDLGFPDAAERKTKLHLAVLLNEILKQRRLKQKDAAQLMGLAQPKISALVNYKLEGFSVEKLMELLTVLDQDVEIAIRPRREPGPGQVSVVLVS